MREETGDSPALTPATVRPKAPFAVAIGAAGAGLLVGFLIALTIALTTNQIGGGATAQTVTSTITAPASNAAAPTGTGSPTTTSTQQAKTDSGPGAFAVGAGPPGGLTAAIPPGRYRAEVKPGAGMGGVMRCNDPLCRPGNTSDLIAATPVFGRGATLVQIQTTDAAVYLISVILTPVD